MTGTILEYLESAASRYPSRIAYEDQQEAVSFEEVKRRADVLGTALARQGVSGAPAAVYMRKSAAMITVFLGAVSCGACYCPIDTAMPEERVRLILQTLQPAVVVTAAEEQGKLAALGFDGPVLVYEEALSGEADRTLLDKARKNRIDTDPLYILFTSGSTGVPKGVVLPHRAVLDYVQWLTGRFRFEERDVLGNQAELFFDLSVQDVYAPLICGCKTVLIPRELFAAPAALMEYVRDKKISVLVWAPSALCMVANLNGMEEIRPDGLRCVMFCGEVMPCKQLNYWRKRLPGVVYINLYGPTETTVASTYYVVDREFSDEDRLPIGIPCENTDVLVLNQEDRPAGVWEQGELCVRGSSLALGYYRDPERTREVFVQNPCNPAYPEWIYRTGDLVYYEEDGNLMYVSRKDHQIKHLGYRIELGEIEAAARLLEGVQECACVYDGERKRILLFYTGEPLETAAARKALQARLPHYMIPNRLCHLEAMPHTASGKLDRKGLKEAVLGKER